VIAFATIFDIPAIFEDPVRLETHIDYVLLELLIGVQNTEDFEAVKVHPYPQASSKSKFWQSILFKAV
jgi:hypothetical protein